MTQKPLPEDRLWQPVTGKWFAVVFGTAVLYSVVRYHLAGDVPWEQFPLFILNKATSLAAVIFIACSYLIGRVIKFHNRSKHKLVVIKFCGLMGFSLAAIHALMSFCLLNPSYFAKFFQDDGKLTVATSLALSAGVVALWAVAIPAITTMPKMAKEIGGIRWKRTQRMGYLCLILTLVHLVFFGWKGWTTPERWHGGLPPISMWAAAAAIFPVLVKIWSLTGGRRR